MVDPATKAKWVLAAKHVGEIPAQSLVDITESEGIAHRSKVYPDSWDGMLVFKGERRAILVNTRIESNGRYNFTFAHELGHYFLEHKPNYLENGQLGIRCTLSDSDSAQKGRESEANCFAAELLMPEDKFRLDMAGAPMDFALIGGLATKYMVSKHAASNRMLDVTNKLCIIITSNGTTIESMKASNAARTFVRHMRNIPKGSVADIMISEGRRQGDFAPCDPAKWFARNLPGGQLYSCTHGSGNHYMTILRW